MNEPRLNIADVVQTEADWELIAAAIDVAIDDDRVVELPQWNLQIVPDVAMAQFVANGMHLPETMAFTRDSDDRGAYIFGLLDEAGGVS